MALFPGDCFPSLHVPDDVASKPAFVAEPGVEEYASFRRMLNLPPTEHVGVVDVLAAVADVSDGAAAQAEPRIVYDEAPLETLPTGTTRDLIGSVPNLQSDNFVAEAPVPPLPVTEGDAVTPFTAGGDDVPDLLPW